MENMQEKMQKHYEEKNEINFGLYNNTEVEEKLQCLILKQRYSNLKVLLEKQKSEIKITDEELKKYCDLTFLN